MEPKFISQYQVTFEMAKHWAAHPVGRKAIRDRKRGILLRVMLMICGAIMILCSVLTQEYFFGIAGILAILIGLERLFLLPKISLKQQYAMILILNTN